MCDNHFLSVRTVCFECGSDRDAGYHSIILAVAESLYAVLCPDSASVPLFSFPLSHPVFALRVPGGHKLPGWQVRVLPSQPP